MNRKTRINAFLIAGARPNFMKIAPAYREALKHDQVECRIVHTGQHYDYEMSQAFLEDLGLPEPDFFLNVGSASHAVQTAKIMIAFEELCVREGPDLVIVVGDVNSTLACTVVAKKLLIKVAHVEAGLRSFDHTMPEEVNRIVTDSLTDYFFVTEQSGLENLVREGKPRDAIHFVGNVMIDNLFYQVRRLEDEDVEKLTTFRLKQEKTDYVFLTLHRPSNVDYKECFEEMASALNEVAEERPILFPVHPRTQKMMDKFDIRFSPNITLLPPLRYRESLFLWKDACLVMTDSGGLQEETTAMRVPCVTLRDNTERPITMELGTNVLGGTKRESILKAYRGARENRNKGCPVPPKWDGKAAERIWNILLTREAQ